MRETLPKRERVPDYYADCPQSRAILEVLAQASLKAKAAFEDVTDQFFLETATWGLPLWEEQAGIDPDAALSDAARRAAVRQKLTASGNTTAEMVRDMAESLLGYQARVILNTDYSFSLELLGEETTLVSLDTASLRELVEQIKPAHLRFIIIPLRWMDIEDLGLTWRWFDEDPTTWYQLEDQLFCVHRDGPDLSGGVYLNTYAAVNGNGTLGSPFHDLQTAIDTITKLAEADPAEMEPKILCLSSAHVKDEVTLDAPVVVGPAPGATLERPAGWVEDDVLIVIEPGGRLIFRSGTISGSIYQGGQFTIG